MDQTIAPLAARRSGPLRGRARVPGDKSISHRSLILGGLTVLCLMVGLAALPWYVAHASVSDGSVRTVLDGWTLPSQEIHAVFPSPKSQRQCRTPPSGSDEAVPSKATVLGAGPKTTGGCATASGGRTTSGVE